MDREFYEFYGELGQVKLPVMQRGFRSRFEQKAWDPTSGIAGHEYQMEAMVETPSQAVSLAYQEIFLIGLFESKEEPVAFHTLMLAQIRQAQRQVEPGSQLWQKLQGRVASSNRPMFLLYQGSRINHENANPPYVDKRKQFGQLQDVNVSGNPNIETKVRFSRAIKAAQRAQVIPGQNGEFKAGMTWGPAAASVSWADQDKDDNDWGLEDAAVANLDDTDRKVVDTHHDFIFRHYRSRRMGLRYHGYEEVFRHQRDGVPFTSADLTKNTWNLDRNGPIQFVSENGITAVKYSADARNPALDKLSIVTKEDLRTILENHEWEKEKRNRLKSMRAAAADAAAGPSASAPVAAPPPMPEQPQMRGATWKRR